MTKITQKNNDGAKTYTPEQLKVLFEALHIAPSYMSKRFILTHLLGWSDEELKLNVTLIEEEANMKRMGKTGI